MLLSDLLNDRPGVLLVSLRVAHADATACAEQLHLLSREIERVAGFRSIDVIRRDGGLGTDFYIIVRFESLEAVERWRASPERHALLDRIVEFGPALLVEDLLEQARRDTPEIEPHFDDARLEPVFVKNLENVQGDERDIMFFSVGYGRDEDGKITIGPVQRNTGASATSSSRVSASKAVPAWGAGGPRTLSRTIAWKAR